MMAPISRSEFKQQIQEMDPTRFEHFVADLWSAQGWNTEVTQEQGDKGIDIVATRDSPVSEKHLIQAKRYAPDNPVGSPEVQQYASLRQQEEAVDAVVIVTSGRFSDQAERVARDLNVKLIDGDDLYEVVESHELSAIVTDYLEPPEASSQGANQIQSISEKPTDTTSNGSELSKRSLGVSASVILIALVLAGGAIALAGLGGPNSGVDSSNPAGANHTTMTPILTPTPEQTTTKADTDSLAVGESTTQDGLRITVVNYTYAQRLNNTAPSYGKPEEGAKFLLVYVTVENVGNVQQHPPTRVPLFYYNQQIGRYGLFAENFTVAGQMYHQYPTNRFSIQIYPEETVEGWIIYEVPRGFDPTHAVIQIGFDTDLRWHLNQTETPQ